MHRPLLFLLPLLLVGPAALGADPPPAASGRSAQRATELEQAFAALHAAPDEMAGALIEARIRALWQQQAGPAAGLLMRRAARNLSARQPADALEDCDAAITLQPDFAEAWVMRATAYAAGGDAAAAARDLQEALRLEPRHWTALETLAGLQEEAGDPAGALRSFQAALALYPKLPGGAARLQELTVKVEGEAL